MKILHLMSGGGIGGIETLCRDIAELSQEQNEFCFLYSGGAIAEEMKRKKIPIHFFYEENYIKRIRNLFCLVKSERYDVIFVHHEGLGIYMSYLMLLYYFKRIKFVKYLHCSYEEKYFYQGNKLKDKINYCILKKTLMKSHCVVAVSEFVKRSYCREFNCEEGKIKVIYNGIKAPQDKRKANKVLLEDKTIRLLYVGRLAEVKGVHLLLYAMRTLLDQGENVELDILGDGEMRLEYEQLSEKLELEEKVHFWGYMLDKQTFYENARIFVYPSIWQEAFGISIIEAMSQGMICVASNAGGIPEVIDDGRDGFLFQSGDSDKLAETLLKVIGYGRSQRYMEVVQRAKQKSQRFDINNTVNALQELCEGLVEE